MSITTGVTGGGSYSNRWTEQAFPRSGLGYTSLGRGNLNLVGFATNRELAMGLVLLGLSGPVGGIARGVALRGLNVATKPVFWAGVNAYQEADDAAAWLRGEDMSWQLSGKIRPVRHPVFGSWAPGVPAIPVPFPYLDFTKTPSSGGGGPGGIPNLHRPPPSIEETGEILSNPPIAGEVPSSPRPSTSKKAGKRRKSCPPGYRWNGRRCVKKG
jgi:hypothetical protein